MNDEKRASGVAVLSSDGLGVSLTERLRTRNGRPDGFGLGLLCDEAADEIERLSEHAVILAATTEAVERERWAPLLAELEMLADRCEWPDGDGAQVIAQMWAEEWVTKIKTPNVADERQPKAQP